MTIFPIVVPVSCSQIRSDLTQRFLLFLLISFFLKLKSQSNSTGPAVSKTNTSIIVSRDKRLDTNDYTRRAIDHLKQASRSNGIMLLWAAPCHWQAYDLKRISESIVGQQLCSSQSRGPDFLTTVARKKNKPQLKCGALCFLFMKGQEYKEINGQVCRWEYNRKLLLCINVCPTFPQGRCPSHISTVKAYIIHAAATTVVESHLNEWNNGVSVLAQTDGWRWFRKRQRLNPRWPSLSVLSRAVFGVMISSHGLHNLMGLNPIRSDAHAKYFRGV